VRRGADVTAVSSNGARAMVTLADGERLTADLVVGADGVRSRVRGVIDPAAPSGRYVGLTNFGGITRGTPLAATLPPESWHFVFGAQAFFGAHPTPDGDVVWFVNVPEPAISRERRASTTSEEWQRRLVGLLAEDAGPGAELVAGGRLELAGDNTYDLPHVPRWTRDRLVLVGDAAHAPSPSSGQGASMALEDAVVLATSVRDRAQTSADLPAALRAYEHARRGRVERIVKAGARSSSSKTLGPVGRRFQEAAMSIVFKYLVTDRSTAWMTGSRLSWDGSHVA
jgi:2-polyprenyl-6-methoxyphenol hydroxylase-like FAD-dependent oxidoreductase